MSLQKLLSGGSSSDIVHLCSTRLGEFDHIHLCTALTRLCRSKKDAEVLSKLTSAMVQQLEADAVSLSPRTLASTAHSFAELRANDQAFAVLAQRITPLAYTFSDVELATTSRGFALKQYADGTMMDALAQAALAKLDSSGPRALANLIWSFTKLDHPMRKEIVRRVKWDLTAFEPNEMAMTLWSLAACVKSDPSLLQLHWERSFSTAVKSKLECFNTESLANVISAMAHLSFTSVLPDLLRRAESKVNDFSGQQLSQISWVVAKYRMPARWFNVLPLDKRYDPKSTALIIWAWATAKPPMNPAPLLRLATPELAQRPARAAMTCWGLATLGIGSDSAFFGALRPAVMKDGGLDFKPEELCNVIFALATFGIEPDLMCHLLIRARKLPSNDPRHWTKLAWSMGNAQIADEELVRTLLRKLTTLPPSSLSSIHVTISLYACALLGAPVSDDAADALLRALPDTAKDPWDMRSRAGGRLAWALAALHLSTPLCNTVLTRIFTSAYKDDTDMEGNSLAARAFVGLARRQAAAHRSGIGSALPLPPLPWSYTFPTHCLTMQSHIQFWAYNAMRSVYPSSQVVCEYTLAADVCVDVALVDLKLAVEIDGPTHFVHWTIEGKKWDGLSAWTSEQIRLLGWRVVRVPTQEVRKMESTKQFGAYVQRELEKAQVM
eukprot:GEMP01016768.1.p1 GENE.GEMP01016768.1~~GEMP01016768.1.p1  ORF type:complete len:667 (+),score=177.40 GEMP01016768.1:141-2141(+)